MTEDIDTRGYIVPVGKYQGKPFTQVPAGYLKNIVRDKKDMAYLASAELKRRGDGDSKIEISNHAVNSASLRCLEPYLETREDGEGLITWLQRMTQEAIDSGKPVQRGKISYCGMRFCIEQDGDFIILKTIIK